MAFNHNTLAENTIFFSQEVTNNSLPRHGRQNKFQLANNYKQLLNSPTSNAIVCVIRAMEKKVHVYATNQTAAAISLQFPLHA